MSRIDPASLPSDHPAHRMVDAFASVGVSCFDISFTDAYEESTGFRPGQTAAQLHNSLRYFIARAAMSSSGPACLQPVVCWCSWTM